METSIKIEGLKELLKKIDGDVLLAEPLRKMLEKSAIAVQNRARLNATGRPGPKVQTGRLRGGIQHRIDGEPIPKWAEIYDNVEYAPSVEFGHKQEVGRFVPIYNMRRIAKGDSKGKYEVSRGLGVRLVKPFAPAYPFFFRAVPESQDKIDKNMETAAREIEAHFES